MIDPNVAILAILEQGQEEADAALVALHALWAKEDEVTARNRAWALAAHAQGERDRDAKRVELGGKSRLEPEQPAEEPKDAA